MKKLSKFILVLAFLGFANCSDLKKGLGFEKDIPDEFLIRKIDPIERPPNYDLLPPDSKEKAKKSKEINTTKNTKSIIDSSLKQKNSKDLKSKEVLGTGSVEESILKQIGQ